MCFENVPCKAFYSWKNRGWIGSQMMWDSFQTSAIILENLPFLCFWNPSCMRRIVLAYACNGSRKQAEGYFAQFNSKNRIFFLHSKCYIFHFNTPQVNLIFDWALNWPWALAFEHHWGMRAQVVRSKKCSVYSMLMYIHCV